LGCNIWLWVGLTVKELWSALDGKDHAWWPKSVWDVDRRGHDDRRCTARVGLGGAARERMAL